MKFLILVISFVFVLHLQVTFAAKRIFEQSCKQSEDCDEDLGLSCQNKVCKCAAGGETVYSQTRRRCVGAAGRECLNYANETLCVENSECQNYEYMHLCACKDVYYQSKDGHCYLQGKYGQDCREEDFSCGDTMTTAISCVEKKCRCLLGEENQYYDRAANKCTSYAGGHCLYHYQEACAPNSKCDSVYENINGALFHVGHKCRCDIGFSYTTSRHCLAAFGSHCNSTIACNYDQHMGCLNEICQCRNPLHEVYNAKLGQCTLLVGASCKTTEGPECTENANCSSKGKCECKKGFSVSPLNTCLVDIGQKCTDTQCNHFNALVCINGTCNCLDENLKYEKENKSCVGLKDLPCGNVSVQIDRGNTLDVFVNCEANSTCSKNGFSSLGLGNSRRICRASSARSN